MKPLTATDRSSMLRELVRIRRVEERIIELYPEQEMRCPTHLSIGQEATAVGVCAHLQRSDHAVSAHRSHAHYLAKGGDLGAMFAELYGKATGCAGGKGGSMHLIDRSVGFLGCVPIVGSTIPIGVGAAFGDKLREQGRVTVIFFGDAAVETGVFHESLNFAALKHLPVLFVCENNLYSVATPLSDRQPAERTIAQLARGHGIETASEDGQDVERVSEAAEQMIDRVRNGGGPGFLELATYRWMEHCGPLTDLDQGFRPPGEYEHWRARCPVEIESKRLTSEGVISTAELDALTREVDAEIDAAVEFARTSPFPEREQLLADVFSP